MPHFRRCHLAAFAGALGVTALALCSPIEPFASLLLSVHMLQHLLLVFIVPPLVWLARPQLPLVAGLPASVRKDWLAPISRSPPVRWAIAVLLNPLVGWLAFVLGTTTWHVPAMYELAIRSPDWHVVEHGTFLAGGLLFWWHVVQPYPSRPSMPRYALLAYLFSAGVASTPLAAFITLYEEVLYAHYADVPSLVAHSAETDQALAGAMMWVAGLVALLVPAALVGFGLLDPTSTHRSAARRSMSRRQVRERPERLQAPGPHSASAVNLAPTLSRFNLLALRLLGRLLRWRHSRLLLQLPLLLLAVLVVVDGLFGPPWAPMNAAGVLPWTHWRGLSVIALVACGNVFCTACPFTLPRRVVSPWLKAPFTWPRAIDGRWLAAALLATFLCVYEVFDLWARPSWTAWIVLGYFAAALAVDSLFRGAAFCQHVCPIGQFHFVASRISPLEVRPVDPHICTTCQTKDCVRGNAQSPGCQLELVVPRKQGNAGCTWCLDCVHACPHTNVGIVRTAALPQLALPVLSSPPASTASGTTSSLGYVALVAVFAFGAFANAAGMVAPVVAWIDQFAASVGVSRIAVEVAFVAAAIVLLPALALTITSLASRVAHKGAGSARSQLATFAGALIPLGFAMWFVHFVFHLWTGAGTAVPVAQRFVGDWQVADWGDPQWVLSCCRPVGAGLLRFEVLALGAGLVASLFVAYRVAVGQRELSRRVLASLAPWAAMLTLLYALGVWIVLQPMEMRGTAGPRVEMVRAASATQPISSESSVAALSEMGAPQ